MQAAGGDQESGGPRSSAGGLTRLTAVGIDRDKNSQQAVKWAVDHLLLNHQSIILVHVRNKAPVYGFTMAEATPDAARLHVEAEETQLFVPYRGFCSRKGIKVSEVILEDSDVSKALNEYIHAQQIHNFVVGATMRNALAKRFRNHDVAATLVKTAPDFCAVYIISKGKAVIVRSSTGPVPANFSPTVTDHEDAVRAPSTRGHRRGAIPSAFPPDQMKTPSRDRPIHGAKLAPVHTQHNSIDIPYQLPRSSLGSRDFSDDSFYHGSSNFPSAADFSIIEEPPSHSAELSGDSSPVNSKQGLEAEMKRLKLELKQTMDMYSSACKDALTAKQKAKELVQLKMEGARKFEEARNAEEAALAMAEMEKARCQAALVAAESAQKKAKVEVHRRKTAEIKALHETEEKNKAWDALAAQKDTRYRKYTIDEIELATEHFSESLKVGEGGYGPVFRACLDHTPVAIKVLRPDAQHGRKQFNQEVEVLCSIRHPNMVLLLGACPEYGCLVYEYMGNGSLEDRLMRRGNTPSIPWPARFRIAAEIATALLFLHQAKPEPLVHRDLKPANILIDRNYISKISDVGLARLVPPSVANQVTQYHMTSAAGTLCYIDPEYQQTGMLGCKSDVYALGVMLLQVITARPPMGLSHHVERAISKGTFEEMLDPTVKDWPVEECLSFAKLALKCCELRRKDRPDLGTVVLPELNRLRNLSHTQDSRVG